MKEPKVKDSLPRVNISVHGCLVSGELSYNTSYTAEIYQYFMHGHRLSYV